MRACVRACCLCLCLRACVCVCVCVCDTKFVTVHRLNNRQVLLWGDEANVWEATKLIENLLARSQLDEQYLACGLSGVLQRG